VNFYLQSPQEVLNEVGSTDNGLTSQEAERRLEQNGKNKLKEAEKKSLVRRFFEALCDPMIIMLLAAAAISAVTTIIQGENDFADLIIILAVVLINTVLSLVQESKAEQAIEALNEMTAATSRVMRDGEAVTVKSEDLVVGDVILLEAGNAVPADCRILESHSIKAEEAALTGESVPVNKLIDIIMLKEGEKDVALGDRKNMLYSGSTVVYGRGRAVVTSVGMDTEMGKIADALSDVANEQTPLQKKMAQLSTTLTKLVLAICAVVFVFGIVRNFISPVADAGIFDVVLDTFILAIALAVAAIPEGLPAVVTIILSMGVTAMSKRQALIRKLTAVETLGCTQIICSDKTGTLTQNKMTVVDKSTGDEKLLAKAMALCSDAEIKPGETESVGEPTECALVNYAYVLGMPKYELEQAAPRVGEAPFDSNRKMMSTIHSEDGKIVQYTKGACEMLLDRCDNYLTESGNILPMTDEIKKAVFENNKGFADRALRVLGAAYKYYDEIPTDLEPEQLEKGLTFIGAVGMIDPCRPEVLDAIRECKEAGIRPIMITGDHIDTAVAIAKELGIITDASQAITGMEINDLTDDELFDAVEKYSVYARVQPEHKTRIVKAWKAHGMVTAMTGDGVNDAPSIKSADIGIGMGITGTDVTKGVADMVLSDDNFATIVNAVEEGRRIYDNVQKVIQFQLSTNMAEVISIFTAQLLGITILSPAHLLWVNMVTDSTPGLALGMEPAEGDLMRRKPRSSDESVFANGAGLDIIIKGIFMAAMILISYFIGTNMGLPESEIALFKGMSIEDIKHLNGMTMAFLTTNFTQMFQAFCMRSQTQSIFKLKTKNNWLIGSLIITAILTISVMYIPFLRNAFDLAPISLGEFAIALGLAVLVIPVFELIKVIKKKIAERKDK